jgi:hypothetical protein
VAHARSAEELLIDDAEREVMHPLLRTFSPAQLLAGVAMWALLFALDVKLGLGQFAISATTLRIAIAV